MLQLTKGQKKKAKKQQKAAMQLTESSPDSPSPMANASSASSPTSGTELQVCPPHQPCSDHILCFCLPLSSICPTLSLTACTMFRVIHHQSSSVLVGMQLHLDHKQCCAPASLAHHHGRDTLCLMRSNLLTEFCTLPGYCAETQYGWQQMCGFHHNDSTRALQSTLMCHQAQSCVSIPHASSVLTCTCQMSCLFSSITCLLCSYTRPCCGYRSQAAQAGAVWQEM